MKKSQSLFYKIKDILFQDWDPIGINRTEGAENEYDGYIPNLSAILCKENASLELVQYLRWIEEERMGLEFNEPAALEIVQKILALKIEPYS
ncbi:hypothetical protein [Xylophilus sp. GOD-11R]|uniref:hypothetical protein n=1 Tax=Xylophilus sp. GOD-11R TaxID=3089814 RepID=UPI00298C3597|nr:hypothetical protein [Xylophilus sp. GOD-11R]WPB56295.1 hypothetical protein R9X41_19440 [Xylophilus sp. GOD-11R]